MAKSIGNYDQRTDADAQRWLAENGWKDVPSVSGGSFGGSGRIYTEYNGHRAIIENGELYVSPDKFRTSGHWKPK